MEWVEALNVAIGYIEDHLLETLSVSDVASQVYISTYHFQRAFSMLTGISMGEYIRNRRLSLAGQALTQEGAKVIDVALAYGYDTPESFSKAFERFHGIMPSKVKSSNVPLKSYNRMIIKIAIEGGSIIQYRIERKKAFKVVLLTEVYNSDTCFDEIPQNWKEYMKSPSSKIVCGELGVRIFDQPTTDTFTYGIGCHDHYVDQVPMGYKTYEIPALTWAIFSCTGPMPESIQNMWRRIYSEWLPQAHYKFLEAYDIEYYTEGDIHSENYYSEIWIPVIEKTN